MEKERIANIFLGSRRMDRGCGKFLGEPDERIDQEILKSFWECYE